MGRSSTHSYTQLWESVLPEVCLRPPAELAGADEWLDDEWFFAPFRAPFDPRLNRPSAPGV
ncbi:MAG TPA: hypothetical protein VFC19_08875 [Candidatus Limnocylindrales bacterium]|nr:hypothetical protein [Candidatus Limnocylindrales bacterium]